MKETINAAVDAVVTRTRISYLPDARAKMVSRARVAICERVAKNTLLQNTVLKTWAGDDAKKDEAQAILARRARENGQAQLGKFVAGDVSDSESESAILRQKRIFPRLDCSVDKRVSQRSAPKVTESARESVATRESVKFIPVRSAYSNHHA